MWRYPAREPRSIGSRHTVKSTMRNLNSPAELIEVKASRILREVWLGN